MATCDKASQPSLMAAAPPNNLRKLMGPLTILTHLISLPALAAGIWLLYLRDVGCEHLLRLRALIVLFAISNAVIFYGGGRKVTVPGMVVLMVPLMAFLLLGLALVGAYKVESRTVPASPVWLERRVSQGEIWNQVKMWIYYSKVCSDLAFRTVDLTSYDFSMLKLSSVESGCCKPPDLCGMA